MVSLVGTVLGWASSRSNAETNRCGAMCLEPVHRNPRWEGQSEKRAGRRASAGLWELLQSRLPAPRQGAAAGAFALARAASGVELCPGLVGGSQKPGKGSGAVRTHRVCLQVLPNKEKVSQSLDHWGSLLGDLHLKKQFRFWAERRARTTVWTAGWWEPESAVAGSILPGFSWRAKGTEGTWRNLSSRVSVGNLKTESRPPAPALGHWQNCWCVSYQEWDYIRDYFKILRLQGLAMGLAVLSTTF